MQPQTIQQIKGQNFTWTNITKTGQDEIRYLKETYGFHPLHLADCLSPAQRPKIDFGENYLFLVLLFPVYRRKTREIIPAEIDFFIGPNFLISVHNNELPPLINLFNTCQADLNQLKKHLGQSPVHLLYKILNELLFYCFPILDTLQYSISDTEQHIFKGFERRMVREILIIKRSIINFRRIMQVHRSVIHKFIVQTRIPIQLGELKPYFENLIETTNEIWDNLENMLQTIEALEETNNALISFRLNDIIKILTIISVIIMPLGLLVNIFGMSLKYMPLADYPAAFWIIISILLIMFLGLFYFFKRKKWL
jgi:magnesium transporter